VSTPDTPTESVATSSADEPVTRVKGRFHLLRQILQNALTLGGALLFYYFLPIGNEDHPIWRWAVFVIGLGVHPGRRDRHHRNRRSGRRPVHPTHNRLRILNYRRPADVLVINVLHLHFSRGSSKVLDLTWSPAGWALLAPKG